MKFTRPRNLSLTIGLVAAAGCAAGAVLTPAQFYPAYLIAFLFWVGLACGSLSLLMMHHMVGGKWGFVSRRLLESGTRTLPLLAVLSIPLLLGITNLYGWAKPEAVAHSEILQQQVKYLNLPFFTVRLVFYFAVWLLLSGLLNRWSSEQDRSGEPAMRTRMQNLSGPGLILHAFVVTFAVVDWVMSLESEWFSTMFGAIFLVGQVLSTLALVVLILMLLERQEPFARVLNPSHFHDLGNLMLAFVMLWAYTSFSQYLIIWSGNLPDETGFFGRRFSGGWEWLALLLLLFHFIVPFLVLLSRYVKRRSHLLAAVAVAMMIFRLVDLIWLVHPALAPSFTLSWIDFVAPIAVGGLWLAFFFWQLERRPLLPLHDPRFQVRV